jgi:hypothetical protein
MEEADEGKEAVVTMEAAVDTEVAFDEDLAS